MEMNPRISSKNNSHTDIQLFIDNGLIGVVKVANDIADDVMNHFSGEIVHVEKPKRENKPHQLPRGAKRVVDAEVKESLKLNDSTGKQKENAGDKNAETGKSEGKSAGSSAGKSDSKENKAADQGGKKDEGKDGKNETDNASGKAATGSSESNKISNNDSVQSNVVAKESGLPGSPEKGSAKGN